jgi:hypothetical protein
MNLLELMLSEIRQSPKEENIASFQFPRYLNSQIYGNRKLNGSWQGVGRKGRGSCLIGMDFSLQKVLEIGFITMQEHLTLLNDTIENG